MAADSERLNGDREAAYANWLDTLKAPDQRGGGWTEGFQLADVAELLEIRLGSARRMKPWLDRFGSAKPNPLSTVCTFEDVSRLALVQRLGPSSHSPAVRAGIKGIVEQDLQVHRAQMVAIGGRSDPEWLRVISDQEKLPTPNSGTVAVMRREDILGLSERAIRLVLPTVPIIAPVTNSIESPELPEYNGRLVVGDLRTMVRTYIDAGGDWDDLVQKAGVPDDLTSKVFQLLCAQNRNFRRLDIVIKGIRQDPNGMSSLRQMASILDAYVSQSATN